MKDERFTRLYEMAKKEVLQDILPFWMEHDVDEENGGFYGVVTREGKPVKEGTYGGDSGAGRGCGRE